MINKVPNYCTSAGNVMDAHSSPIAERVENMVHDEVCTKLEAHPILPDNLVSEQGSCHQCAGLSLPPLSFADIVIRGLSPSDLPTCSILPISDEDQSAALGYYTLAPGEICTNEPAQVKQLDPADSYGQRRTQIEKRLQVLDAGVGGLDGFPSPRSPDAILTGLDPEADIDSDATPSTISRLATKYGLVSLKHGVLALSATPNHLLRFVWAGPLTTQKKNS